MVKVKYKKLENLGEADYEHGVIYLKRGMTRDAKEATLVHEIFHMLNTTMSHKVLDSLAEQWYAVLKENDMLK